MKVSELISKLERLKSEAGDIEVATAHHMGDILHSTVFHAARGAHVAGVRWSAYFGAWQESTTEEPEDRRLVVIE